MKIGRIPEKSYVQVLKREGKWILAKNRVHEGWVPSEDLVESVVKWTNVAPATQLFDIPHGRAILDIPIGAEVHALEERTLDQIAWTNVSYTNQTGWLPSTALTTDDISGVLTYGEISALIGQLTGIQIPKGLPLRRVVPRRQHTPPRVAEETFPGGLRIVRVSLNSEDCDATKHRLAHPTAEGQCITVISLGTRFVFFDLTMDRYLLPVARVNEDFVTFRSSWGEVVDCQEYHEVSEYAVFLRSGKAYNLGRQISRSCLKPQRAEFDCVCLQWDARKSSYSGWDALTGEPPAAVATLRSLSEP